MRKYYIIILSFFILVAAVNVTYFRSLYKMQINQNKNFLFKQTDVCVNEIERTLLKFDSDLNFILFSNDIKQIFANEESDGLRKLQLFYSTYSGLIENIDIYDNNKNVLNIYRDKKQHFITDSYLAQRQRKLLPKEEILINKNEYLYVLPVYHSNELFANILVTININNYILSELKKFRLEDITWQWVIDLETSELSNTTHIDYDWNGQFEGVIADLKEDHENILIHEISNDSLNYKVLSVYTPIKLLNHSFGVAMSVDHNTFLIETYKKLGVISGISLLIFLAVSVFFIWQIQLLKKKIKS